MEPIIYRPYCGYRFAGWALIALVITLCFVYLVFPSLIFVIPGILLIRYGKLTVILDDTGVRLLHEKSCPDRLIPWEQLSCYRLDNTPRGHDVLILSPIPMPPEVARRFAWRPNFSRKLWCDGVLVIPLSGMGNTEAVRKFAYQKCVNK